MRKVIIKQMVTLSILGGLVAILSLIKIPLGQFSITFALIPLVVGAILFGPKGGAFLGLIMGIVILFVDAAYFFAFNPFGTIVTVLLKSTCAGFVSGLVYNLFKKKQFLGIILSSISAPIVNTLVFFLGCLIFFYPLVQQDASQVGKDVLVYILTFYIGLNFVVEFTINCVLAPSVVYIINVISNNYDLGQKKKR